jgi:hypothetical protein
MTSLWTVCNQSVTSVWSVCDQSATSLWRICDQSVIVTVSSLWPICDQSVTNLWPVYDRYQSIFSKFLIVQKWNLFRGVKGFSDQLANGLMRKVSVENQREKWICLKQMCYQLPSCSWVRVKTNLEKKLSLFESSTSVRHLIDWVQSVNFRQISREIYAKSWLQETFSKKLNFFNLVKPEVKPELNPG